MVGKVDKVVDVGPVAEVVASVRGLPLESLVEPVLKVASHHVVTQERLGVTPLTPDKGGGHQGVPAPVSAPPSVSGQEEAGSLIAIGIIIRLRLWGIPTQHFIQISQWFDLFPRIHIFIHRFLLTHSQC